MQLILDFSKHFREKFGHKNAQALIQKYDILGEEMKVDLETNYTIAMCILRKYEKQNLSKGKCQHSSFLSSASETPVC